MPLLLPSICQTTHDDRYRSRLPHEVHTLTPIQEPLEVQERRWMSCSLRIDPYHKPKGK